MYPYDLFYLSEPVRSVLSVTHIWWTYSYNAKGAKLSICANLSN